ncbi:uncharacterized protein LOC103316907 [Nasonia vitripennis]|uniref:Uncharacterized protein n=1 Tax=Nasonia vitripennis TaxID=7425 RepID=A0A7M7H8J0_NASVI|nr:uncharacterized protein LOC103316907 [Nasonia vitripennis]
MNRYGLCSPLRPLLLALVLLTGVTLCEDQPTNSHSVDSDIAGVRTFFDDIFDSSEGKALREGRTFGHKRIQFMMMPMIYKMGVMMTMLAVLTVISLKGLLIGLILLILKLSTIFGKIYSWHSQSYGHHSHAAWTPPQPVHVHVHNNGGYDTHGHGQAQAYSGWEPAVAGPPPSDESYYYKG